MFCTYVQLIGWEYECKSAYIVSEIGVPALKASLLLLLPDALCRADKGIYRIQIRHLDTDSKVIQDNQPSTPSALLAEASTYSSPLSSANACASARCTNRLSVEKQADQEKSHDTGKNW